MNNCIRERWKANHQSHTFQDTKLSEFIQNFLIQEGKDFFFFGYNDLEKKQNSIEDKLEQQQEEEKLTEDLFNLHIINSNLEIIPEEGKFYSELLY